MMTVRMVAAMAVWALAATVPLYAASRPLDRQMCKHVRDAVWAGHTMEQLTAEFDTDAEHVMKCVQSRKGKKPKGKQGQKSAPATDHASKRK